MAELTRSTTPAHATDSAIIEKVTDSIAPCSSWNRRVDWLRCRRRCSNRAFWKWNGTGWRENNSNESFSLLHTFVGLWIKSRNDEESPRVGGEIRSKGGCWEEDGRLIKQIGRCSIDCHSSMSSHCEDTYHYDCSDLSIQFNIHKVSSL